MFPDRDISGTPVYNELDSFVNENLQNIDLSEKILEYYRSIEKCKILSRYSQSINQINTFPKCPICLSNHVSSFLPCGHTGCKECLSRLDRCHVCRGDTNGRIHNIFYP